MTVSEKEIEMDFNSYEYTVEQKSEGKWKRAKILMILFYTVYVLAYFIAIYATRIFTLGALIPFTLWILVFFTWRYVKPEYKYSVESGVLTFTVIYGGKSSKIKFKTKLGDAVSICPAEQTDTAEFSPEKIYNALPSADCPDRYVMLFYDEKNQKSAFYFRATKAALKVMHYYCSRTVITDTVY